MKVSVQVSFIFFSFILFCRSCKDVNTSNNSLTTAKTHISVDDFEEIAANEPLKYLNNPDSFLNSLFIDPQDAYEHEAYSNSLIFIAYNLREHGNIFKSIQYYEKALNYIKNKNIPDIDISLYILKPLAALYIHVDDNQKAITLLENLLDSLKPSEYTQHLGLVNNLANAYIYNGEPQKAIDLISEQINTIDSSITKALLFNTLSTAYALQEKTPESRTYNKHALAEFDKYELQADTLIWYCSALKQYAELHKSSSEITKAIQILTHEFPNTQYRNKANAYLSLADIYFEKNDFKTAAETYKIAFQNFQQESKKYILDYKYTYTLLGLARSFKAENKVDSAFAYYEWAIENDFRTQQLITSDNDQLRNNIWNKNILEELISLYNSSLEIQTEENRETLLWCIELSKARLLINEINRSENWSLGSDQVKSAIHQIRQLYQKRDATDSEQEKKYISDQITNLKNDFQIAESYFETINFNPSKSDFLQKIKDKKNTYYSFYIHQDKSLSIVFTDQGKLAYKRVDTSIIDNLLSFKSTYFADSPNAFNNNPQRYLENAKYLSLILLPNLKNSKQNIFLSLDGDLYGLPFDALYDQNYLVQSYNFAYLNSFLLFDFITNNAPTNVEEISLLYRTEFPNPLPSLKFVNQEVENLTTKFKTLAISPVNQSDSTIRNAFARTNIIHIAAHTILDTVESPYLYLHQAISTDQLRFFEIKTPLVFLSACNTGSGIALPSEGTESIQRVFMSKNVPSVISTYWFANDEVMLELTSKFYDELYTSRKPMFALAEAKRNFINQASPQQQNPWYWANINYTGIGNEVGLKKSSNLLIAILGFTIFTFMGIILYKTYRGRIK
ncbi:CHAT domain-containing protein [Sphingobacterium bovisgrunnientis]|jgi:CHAT domain-containing protein|uniref:CHAT domain-containing protein n=1 Tax=Sphingobacterium bovisgrunnientis TaxID=1874697 RepID=UPI00135740BD|nr:CHAT domain-containing protein [Sphingobacterium bovisgrunnientis]